MSSHTEALTPEAKKKVAGVLNVDLEAKGVKAAAFPSNADY